jgi:hypothetical protein
VEPVIGTIQAGRGQKRVGNVVGLLEIGCSPVIVGVIGLDLGKTVEVLPRQLAEAGELDGRQIERDSCGNDAKVVLLEVKTLSVKEELLQVARSAADNLERRSCVDVRLEADG